MGCIAEFRIKWRVHSSVMSSEKSKFKKLLKIRDNARNHSLNHKIHIFNTFHLQTTTQVNRNNSDSVFAYNKSHQSAVLTLDSRQWAVFRSGLRPQV